MTDDPVDVEWDPIDKVFKVPQPPARYIDERGRVIRRCTVCGRDGYVEGASYDRHFGWAHPDKVVPPMHERPMDWLWAWFRGTFPRS